MQDVVLNIAQVVGWVGGAAAGVVAQAESHAPVVAAHGAEGGVAAAQQGAELMMLVPALAGAAAVLCGLCAALRIKNKLPAWITVSCLAAAFVVTLLTYLDLGHGLAIAHGFEWINFQWAGVGKGGKSFVADVAFYIDPLTLLWMLFVTGLGTLIALYASEYMSHDVGAGYCRFFAAFSLFVLSMACLVMADNLVLLYLGWEGVGLCSYLLIGYFYKKPSAVAAAKKAFIMNRIGDLGLAMGIMATYVTFGTVEYDKLFAMVTQVGGGVDGSGALLAGRWQEWVIPLLFTCGAFGKSAQIFFYVWLPDAMEGPTPVSALIHAATMVTAGVFLIARMYPVYMIDADHTVLNFVAWSGAITALWSATIGMAQFDIKRVMAYSTVSQLGYMFAGLGVLGSIGGASHVFTHAFFKALLFLACGAVMHGFAGQLDLRKLSGVGKMPGWRIVGLTMLVGCLNLAGFPFLAGYWSKDMILADAFSNPHLQAIGWILLATAGLTAYYTFRVYFRVFAGPMYFEPGDEAHGADDHARGHEDGHGHDSAKGQGHAAGGHEKHGQDAHATFHPHPPGFAINLVLVILALASFAVIPLFFIDTEHHGWVGGMVSASSAAQVGHGEHAEHATLFGYDPHKAMYYVSAAVGFIGIFFAWRLHLAGRTTAAHSRADALAKALGPIAVAAQRKWYVDEVYDFLVVRPLWVFSHIFHLIDVLIVDGLVNLFGMIPRALGQLARRMQTGVLHDYALRMAAGVAALLLVLFADRIPMVKGMMESLEGMTGGAAHQGSAGGHEAAPGSESRATQEPGRAEP